MRRRRQEPDNSRESNSPSFDLVKGQKATRNQNHFKIVSIPETKENPLLRRYLIEQTEILFRTAKDGTLKGLGGFADYGKIGYMFGLEGSYLENPGSAMLPLKRLENRIMNQVEQEDL